MLGGESIRLSLIGHNLKSRKVKWIEKGRPTSFEEGIEETKEYRIIRLGFIGYLLYYLSIGKV